MPELSVFEVEMAIGKLKGCKSPGSDQIPAKLIKVGGRTIHSEIHELITFVWNKEELPEEWKESIIVPIYEGWLISKVSYRVVSLVVGGKKHLHLWSVVDTVQYIRA